MVNNFGLEGELGESCGSVVEDELEPEFDDNPQRIFFPCLVRCRFDRWPTHRYIRVLRRTLQVTELQACLRVIAMLRQDRKHILVLPLCLRFFIGRHHRCGCPGSPQSFL